MGKTLILNIQMLCKNYNLIIEFTKRDFLQRYRGSILGFMWAILWPLLMLGIYSFIFVVIFKFKWNNDASSGDMLYTLMIFSALIPFNIFSESVNRSSVALPQNANYIKKVAIPIEVIPISIVLSTMVNSLFSLVLLSLGKVIFLDTPNWTLIFAPLALVPIFLLSVGSALFISALGVYLRDLAHATSIVLNMTFYLSPIFYSTELIPQRFQFLVSMNPIAPIIEINRDIFVRGELFDGSTYLISLFISIAVLIFGFLSFYHLRKGFADVI